MGKTAPSVRPAPVPFCHVRGSEPPFGDQGWGGYGELEYGRHDGSHMVLPPGGPSWMARQNRSDDGLPALRRGRSGLSFLAGGRPTGDLDEKTAESLNVLIHDMHREYGLTSLIATHNPRLAESCDRVLRLEEGILKAE